MRVLPPQERFFNFENSSKIKELFLLSCEVFKDYRFIMLPTLEFYSPELYGEGTLLVGSSQDGGLVCLRKDWTLSLARFLSLYRELDLPLKVFYFGSTFSSKGEIERLQAGIEYLGEKGIEAELEVIGRLSEFLMSCGLSNIVLSLGHVEIAESLLQRYGHDYREALLSKNFSKLSSAPELRELLLTQGGEEVLLNFERKYPEFSSQCSQLRELASRIKGIDIIFDLSELRPQGYYTGIVFEFFHPSIGSPIAGGGRYDGLYRSLGREVCAVGGAVYLDLLLDI